jgi:hypothetical protein
MVYKVDNNQYEIIKIARKMGFSVAVTSMVKHGFTDAVFGLFGLNFLVEIKNGKLSPSRKKLTFMEENFHERWKGSIHIIYSPEDVIKLYNIAYVMSQRLQGVKTQF